MHAIINDVTLRIIERSQVQRHNYLDLIQQQAQRLQEGPARYGLSCTNLAHDVASAENAEKLILKQSARGANIGIVTAYNDVLSAHQPYRDYPQMIKQQLAALGHVGQVAAGVPAMCDGVTQGQLGMELSLFSRDTIALSTAVALSHDVFDGVVLLGICDKIVPGMLMAALRFGHLPALFLPSGPMPSGLSNSDKARVRQQFAAGKIDKHALLESETQSYHSPGTCTFYGTANSNQVLMEIMGLQLPGSSFVNPDDPLRPRLNQDALQRLVRHTALETEYLPLGQMLDEKSFVNAMVGLLATGGSTNHSIHLLAMARMAGILLTWQDLADLSAVVPLLARIYPNGEGDINQFQQAGGMSFLIDQLLCAGMLHEDVSTVMGKHEGLSAYTRRPYLRGQSRSHQPLSSHPPAAADQAGLAWERGPKVSLDLTLLAPSHAPFMREGGLKLLRGNLGRALMKISAVPEEKWQVSAEAMVFTDQHQVVRAYEAGELNRDVVLVVKYQGPKANGMPELHKLMPILANLQEAGHIIALLTDGRLSGASGKVPSALHLCPEALEGGAIDRIADGDLISLDGHLGHPNWQPSTEKKEERQPSMTPVNHARGCGRELFGLFRHQVSAADQGALPLDWLTLDSLPLGFSSQDHASQQHPASGESKMTASGTSDRAPKGPEHGHG